ncbi:MAG: hypothetical protein JST67_06235 [Bacteroidetes bacterium]|nr:hypothetical protein [Bacteroidota bacterium]
MKKVKLCLLFFLCSIFCLGQEKMPIRLFYKSSDINTPKQDTLNIKWVRPTFFGRSIKVKLKNKTKITFKADTIWGYQNEEGRIYRQWWGGFMKVCQCDSLCIYMDTPKKKSTIHDAYYLSKGVDGAIFPLSWRYLKKEFEDNDCFLQGMKKKTKWNCYYLEFDKKNNSYKIIEIFNDCLSDVPYDDDHN